MIYLVDTGILLRAIHRPNGARPEILSAVSELLSRGDVLVTSTQNLREFWNVSTRPSTSRGGYGRSVERTARWLQLFQRLLRIVPETNATLSIWTQLVQQYRVMGAQVHDAHVVAIMQSHAITDLLTLNPDDFRRFPGIRTATPTEIVAAG
ncbi:MAG: type II toxin-antitoxin system VapC family toxin [Planctomycetia bacterium]|nr:type II toxin-antitoxin system VapC family toxin [Planctomycetia bacterium]